MSLSCVLDDDDDVLELFWLKRLAFSCTTFEFEYVGWLWDFAEFGMKLFGRYVFVPRSSESDSVEESVTKIKKIEIKTID